MRREHEHRQGHQGYHHAPAAWQLLEGGGGHYTVLEAPLGVPVRVRWRGGTLPTSDRPVLNLLQRRYGSCFSLGDWVEHQGVLTASVRRRAAHWEFLQMGWGRRGARAAGFRRLPVPDAPAWFVDVSDTGSVFHLVHQQGPRRTVTVSTAVALPNGRLQITGPSANYRRQGFTRGDVIEYLDRVLTDPDTGGG